MPSTGDAKPRIAPKPSMVAVSGPPVPLATLAKRGTAGKDFHRTWVGNVLVNELSTHAPRIDLGTEGVRARLSAQRVNHLELVGVLSAQVFECVAVDHVIPGAIAVNHRMADLEIVMQRVLDNAPVGNKARTSANVHHVVGAALNVVGKVVRAGEAGDLHARAARDATHQNRREQRGILRNPWNVAFLFDRHRQVFLVG